MKSLVILRRLLWGVVAVACIAVGAVFIWRWQGRAISKAKSDLPLEGLKNYGAVPDFTFTERNGRKVSLADLKGKIWVAQFFYTHCIDICPLTVPQMGLLHLEYLSDPDFRSAVRFVSITVDPERDTPEVLRKYAEHFSADPGLWLFLTGDKAQTIQLAQQGFKLGIGEAANPPEIEKKTGEEKELFHSNRLILIDGKRRSAAIIQASTPRPWYVCGAISRHSWRRNRISRELVPNAALLDDDVAATTDFEMVT